MDEPTFTALRELLAAATPGPWADRGRMQDWLRDVDGPTGAILAAAREDDARLIVALRNLAPELLARLDQLTGERDALLEERRELTRAAAERSTLKAHLAVALSWVYEPCDQTVQCPCCHAVLWYGSETLDQDWHEPGCEVQAAELAAGRSVNVQGTSRWRHLGAALADVACLAALLEEREARAHAAGRAEALAEVWAVLREETAAELEARRG